LQQQDPGVSERFWRAYLQPLAGPTLLAHVMPWQQPGSGHGTWQWQLSPAQTQALQRLAQAERLTLNTIVQGVWALLLQRYTGQRTVVFGATVAGRPASLCGAEHLVGLCINTLPVVHSPPSQPSVVAWLRALQADAVALREHEHTPLYEIQRWAGQSGQALFDSLLVFENYPVHASLRQPPAGVRLGDVRTVEATHYALTIAVTVGTTLEMRFDYDRAQFDETGVARLSAHLAYLLAQVMAHPARAVETLGLLTAEAAAQVAAWNTRPACVVHDTSVPALISRQAKIRPEAVALVYAGQQLTYGVLERRANQLAQRLLRLGVRVGLSVERSLAMIVGMLGIWKAGGAYVPLDPVYPSERLAYMLTDAGIGLLVRQHRLWAQRAVPAGVLCVDLEDDRLDAEPATPPAVRLLPEHLALRDLHVGLDRHTERSRSVPWPAEHALSDHGGTLWDNAGRPRLALCIVERRCRG
jgi:non-ribosomal peptide synthetase component F